MLFLYPFCREVRNIKSKTYEEFVEKFKPKKTTDDCYTPSEIYEVIKDWVCKRYNIDPENVIRPFWPGGDYEKDEYPPGCVVVDNPPFSILKNICEFYLERGIPFFLFAPSLTALSGKTTWDRMNHIVCDCSIVYENGATVRTSFITSFEPETVAETSPELTKLVNDLEAMGLVKRIHDERNRRQVYVTLTDDGRNEFKEIKQAMLECTVAGLKDFSEDELEQLGDCLERLIPLLEKFRGNC